ncbi:MAG: hypothetical protein ACRD0U_07965 [Acidimicrobiales bacterium]
MLVVLVSCNGDDSGPTTFGRAEVWVGDGDETLLNVGQGLDGNDVVLPVPGNPWMLASDVEARVRGIGVAPDGTVMFEWAGRFFRVDRDGAVESFGGGDYLVDIAVTAAGEVLGAPQIFPADRGPALVRYGDEPPGEQIGPGETPSRGGPGRLAVAPDGSVFRTVLERRLLRIATDGTVTEVPIETDCSSPRLLGVAADARGLWAGYQSCGAIARIETNGSARLVISERSDPGNCVDSDELPFSRHVPPTQVVAYGLAVDDGGRLWVADPFCGTLEILDNGTLVPVSREVADVVGPIDLGFDADGNLFVLDIGRRAILRIAATDLPG